MLGLTAVAPGAALVAGSAAALFVALVAVLHWLKPALTPSAHMISEYALGEHGWLMRTAFYCLALSCGAMALAVWSDTPSSVGPLLLLVAAVGAAGAGYFITDPVGLVPARPTPTSILHVAFSFIFIPLFPLAVTLVDASLGASARVAVLWPWLPWLSAAVWLGFLAFMGSSLYAQRHTSERGPAPPVGYCQRFMVLTYAGWLLLLAWTIGPLG